MQLRARLLLENARGEAFMGAGLLCLLEAIGREHSIAQAARAMGLSYVKALRILQRLECNLGRRVVRRHKGGVKRGGTDLTPAGSRLASDFRQIQRRLEQSAARASRAFCRRHSRGHGR